VFFFENDDNMKKFSAAPEQYAPHAE